MGKTTVAASIALALAKRGGRVTLSTTDPAAHLALTLDGEAPGVNATRIDPAAEVAQCTPEVFDKAGKNLDAGVLAMLEEDLCAPCTEEIAVFRAFTRTVDEGSEGFVVLDTAPTGHTILLLDASDAYRREVADPRRHARCGLRAIAAVQRPGLHARPGRDAAGGDSSPWGGATPTRPAAGRHPALRLGHQCFQQVRVRANQLFC